MGWVTHNAKSEPTAPKAAQSARLTGYASATTTENDHGT